MREHERKQLAVMRRQAKALERIADAVEREMEPVLLAEGVEAEAVTWQDAVRIMRDTCAEAEDCSDACEMFGWCSTFNKDGSAPAKWEPVEVMV